MMHPFGPHATVTQNRLKRERQQATDRYVVVIVSKHTGWSYTWPARPDSSATPQVFVGDDGAETAHKIADEWNANKFAWQAFVVGLHSDDGQ